MWVWDEVGLYVVIVLETFEVCEECVGDVNDEWVVVVTEVVVEPYVVVDEWVCEECV